MKRLLTAILLVMAVLMSVGACAENAPAARPAQQSEKAILVRISEIEVYPQHLDAYLAAAREVGAVSVRDEPGVVCIYPMVQQRDRCQIRILEIYRDQTAYKSHIASAHFQAYKQGTLHMVKSLDLVDMKLLNANGMADIFKKMELKCLK